MKDLFEIRVVWVLRLAIALFTGLFVGADRTWAQVTPDLTLGSEGSVVNPNLNIRGLPSDLIEGELDGARICSIAFWTLMWRRGAGFTSAIRRGWTIF